MESSPNRGYNKVLWECGYAEEWKGYLPTGITGRSANNGDHCL